MKRIIVFILLAVIAVGVLTACSGKETCDGCGAKTKVTSFSEDDGSTTKLCKDCVNSMNIN